MPSLRQAGQRTVELGDKAPATQDGQSESKRHGHVRSNAPDEVVFSPPGRRREDDANGDSEETGEGLPHPLTLDESDDAGENCDARRRDERRHEGTRGHKNDDKEQTGRGGFDDAARAAEGTRPGEFLRGGLIHPARSRHQPSPAITRYSGLMMTRRSPTRPTVPSTSRRCPTLSPGMEDRPGQRSSSVSVPS